MQAVRLRRAVVADLTLAPSATVGSATFVVVSLNGTQLRSGNVGDSGYGCTYARPPLMRLQVYGFPQQRIDFSQQRTAARFQLSVSIGVCSVCAFLTRSCFRMMQGTGSTDSPADAATHVLEMQENDIVVLGSDGLFDNVFDEVIASMVKVHPKTTELADRLSKVAAANGADINFMSPFAVNVSRFAHCGVD